MTGRVASLDSSESEYAQLAWRDDSADLAVLREFEDEDHEEAGHVLLAWRGLDETPDADQLDPTAHDAIGADERIVEFRSLTWAADGESIFFGVKGLERWPRRDDDDADDEGDTEDDDDAGDEDDTEDDDADSTGPDLDPAEMEIWRSTDERTLPTQKRDERNDEQRNDLFVWHLDSDRALRLSDASLDRVQIVADGELVIATNDDAYTYDGMFGRGRVEPPRDRPELWASTRSRPRASAFRTEPVTRDDSFISTATGEFYAYDRDSRETQELSAGAAGTFSNSANDFPVPEPSYGVAGWTEGDNSLLVYDEFDVWELPVDDAPTATDRWPVRARSSTASPDWIGMWT